MTIIRGWFAGGQRYPLLVPSRAIASYPTRTEADVVVARLASEGIVAHSVTDSAGGVEPQLELIRGVAVLVAEEDLEDAALILDVDVPAALPPLTDSQERVVRFLQWSALAVSAFGLATVLWRVLSG